jgi:hypothetical protein
VNSLSRIPPSLAESSPRRKPALVLRLYEFLLTAVFINVWLATIRLSESTGVNPNIDCETPDCESRFKVLAYTCLGNIRALSMRVAAQE